MAEALYTPAQVAGRLGLTAGMVRRYGLAYEAVTGEGLPRDRKSRARLYDEQALGILEQARGIVKENPNLSAADAVRACLGIMTAPTAPVMPSVGVGEVLELLRAQGAELRALRAEVRGLKEQPALPSSPRSDGDLLVDLERRNRYLEGELRRRDEQPAPRRAWWKVWVVG
jgi:hypothetical protein